MRSSATAKAANATATQATAPAATSSSPRRLFGRFSLGVLRSIVRDRSSLALSSVIAIYVPPGCRAICGLPRGDDIFVSVSVLARSLHLAPKPDRTPALLDDAADHLVDEVALGLEQCQAILAFDHEDWRKFLA